MRTFAAILIQSVTLFFLCTGCNGGEEGAAGFGPGGFATNPTIPIGGGGAIPYENGRGTGGFIAWNPGAKTEDPCYWYAKFKLAKGVLSDFKANEHCYKPEGDLTFANLQFSESSGGTIAGMDRLIYVDVDARILQGKLKAQCFTREIENNTKIETNVFQSTDPYGNPIFSMLIYSKNTQTGAVTIDELPSVERTPDFRSTSFKSAANSVELYIQTAQYSPQKPDSFAALLTRKTERDVLDCRVVPLTDSANKVVAQPNNVRYYWPDAPADALAKCSPKYPCPGSVLATHIQQAIRGRTMPGSSFVLFPGERFSYSALNLNGVDGRIPDGKLYKIAPVYFTGLSAAAVPAVSVEKAINLNVSYLNVSGSGSVGVSIAESIVNFTAMDIWGNAAAGVFAGTPLAFPPGAYTGTSTATISFSKVAKNGGGGINAYANSLTVFKSEIVSNAKAGIEARAATITIDSNTIQNNQGTAGVIASGKSRFVNNIIVGNAGKGIQVGISGATSPDGDPLIIGPLEFYFNTIISPKTALSIYGSPGPKILNNILYTSDPVNAFSLAFETDITPSASDRNMMNANISVTTCAPNRFEYSPCVGNSLTLTKWQEHSGLDLDSFWGDIDKQLVDPIAGDLRPRDGSQAATGGLNFDPNPVPRDRYDNPRKVETSVGALEPGTASEASTPLSMNPAATGVKATFSTDQATVAPSKSDGSSQYVE